MMSDDRFYYDVIIAGFGGQGVMVIGNLLAYAAMKEGRHVTYLPVYGVEMRGGTANCTVMLSSDRIGSPVTHHPSSLVAMNKASLQRFESAIQPGGFLVINSSLVDRDAERSDLAIAVFAEETEDYLPTFVKTDMLRPKCRGSDGVCLIRILLVSHPYF
jgi:2-oxoglutarate ferredoxin oxidoreductase subunit gamma